MFEDKIIHYPDFPKEGIDFIDVLPLLQNKATFTEICNQFSKLTTCPNIATVEARGFLFAAPLLVTAPHVQTIIPFRKKGKLPYSEGDLQSICIAKEYGNDEVFFRISDVASCVPDGDTIYISLFDDLLATGGTALGIANALNRLTVTKNGKTYQVKIKEFLFITELPDLHGADVLSPIAPVHSIMKIAGV